MNIRLIFIVAFVVVFSDLCSSHEGQDGGHYGGRHSSSSGGGHSRGRHPSSHGSRRRKILLLGLGRRLWERNRNRNRHLTESNSESDESVGRQGINQGGTQPGSYLGIREKRYDDHGRHHHNRNHHRHHHHNPRHHHHLHHHGSGRHQRHNHRLHSNYRVYDVPFYEPPRSRPRYRPSLNRFPRSTDYHHHHIHRGPFYDEPGYQGGGLNNIVGNLLRPVWSLYRQSPLGQIIGVDLLNILGLGGLGGGGGGGGGSGGGSSITGGWSGVQGGPSGRRRRPTQRRESRESSEEWRQGGKGGQIDVTSEETDVEEDIKVIRPPSPPRTDNTGKAGYKE